eukprot:scaffold18093_cov73-Isochrysis_galbana.AAC.1
MGFVERTPTNRSPPSCGRGAPACGATPRYWRRSRSETRPRGELSVAYRERVSLSRIASSNKSKLAGGLGGVRGSRGVH